MTDYEQGQYVSSRAMQLRGLIEGLFLRQGIKLQVEIIEGQFGENDWLFSPGFIFSGTIGVFYLSIRGHISRLLSDNPRDIARWIERDVGLQTKMSNKDDIIAYKIGMSMEIIDQVIDICNRALLPEERAERERLEEQEKKDKEYKALFDKIITDASKEIRLKPNDADNYKLRGTAYSQEKLYDQAIIDFNKAIQLNPEDAEAYASRGGAYTEKKEYDNAISDFNEAIRLNPNCISAYRFRGAMYGVKGEYVNSISNYNEVLRLDPKDNVTAALLENVKQLKKQAEHEKNKGKRALIARIIKYVAIGIAILIFLKACGGCFGIHI